MSKYCSRDSNHEPPICISAISNYGFSNVNDVMTDNKCNASAFSFAMIVKETSEKSVFENNCK